MLACNIPIPIMVISILLDQDFTLFNNDYSIVMLLAFILVLLLFFIIQAIFIVIKIYSQPNPYFPKVVKSPLLVKALIKIIYFIEVLIHRVSLLFPLLYYMFITVMLIIIYAIFYNGLNEQYAYNQLNSGYYMAFESIMDSGDENDLGKKIYFDYPDDFENSTGNLIRIPTVSIILSEDELQSNIFKIFMSEYTYFSATTFYTVGYGDVDIRGRVPKLITHSEMFLSSFFNIIFVPLMLFFITDYISRKMKKPIPFRLRKRSNKEFDILKLPSRKETHKRK